MSDGTKADDIALALEEAIVSGEIPPGSTLRQEHLSEQFQVSRTPVEQAYTYAMLVLLAAEDNLFALSRALDSAAPDGRSACVFGAASAAQDFSIPDGPDEHLLNQAIWASVKGGTPMPAPVGASSSEEDGG